MDGCSVPSWWLSISQCATAYARLSSPGFPDEDEKPAIDRMFDAYHKASWYTAGTDRLGTSLNAVGNGKWLGKIGGEGIFGVGFRDEGIGVIVKVESGESRAIPPALLLVMKTWGLIDNSQLKSLSDWIEVARPNAAKKTIGSIRVANK